MLLAQKVAVEGAMALTGYCAYLVDLQKIADDDAERERLNLLLGVLAPVAKSWPSEHCLEANKLAIQIFSAATAIRATFPSSASIATTGSTPFMRVRSAFRPSTCLDEKSGMTVAADLTSSARKLQRLSRSAALSSNWARKARRSGRRSTDYARTTYAVLSSNDLALGLANATIYLDAFGHALIGWMWLWQATVATKALRAGAEGEERSFYAGNWAACCSISLLLRIAED